MAEERLDQIIIPTAYLPVPFTNYGSFSDQDKRKREVLTEHNGEWVLLNYELGDHEQEEYFLTKLRIDPNEAIYFYSQTINGEGGSLKETQMQYHYVGGILVPKKGSGLLHQFETESEVVGDFFGSQ